MDAVPLLVQELSQESAAYGGHLRLGFERIWNSMDFADIRLLVGNEEVRTLKATSPHTLYCHFNTRVGN